MGQILSQLFIYVFQSTIIAYLIISIFKRKLPLPKHLGGHGYYYKGWKAIVMSFFFLFIILPLFFRIENFDLIFFLSLIIGISIAFVSHNLLCKSFAENPSLVIPDKIPPRKLEASNLILWGIVGIFPGFFTFMFAAILFGMIGFSYNVSIILAIPIFIATIILIARWGARTTWMR